MPKHNDDDDDSEFDALKDAEPVTAIGQLKSAYAANDRGHREQQWLLIGRAVSIWERLQETEQDIAKFVGLPFWEEKPYKPNKKKLLLLTMQYMVGARDTKHRRYRTANDYAKAVQILLDEGCNPRTVGEELKLRKGPYGLIKELTRADKAKADDSPEVGKDVEQEENTEEKHPAATRPASKPSESKEASGSAIPLATKATGGKSPSIKSPRIFQADRDIAFDPGVHFDKIFNLEVEGGLWVYVERKPDKNGVRKFKVMKLRAEPMR